MALLAAPGERPDAPAFAKCAAPAIEPPLVRATDEAEVNS